MTMFIKIVKIFTILNVSIAQKKLGHLTKPVIFLQVVALFSECEGLILHGQGDAHIGELLLQSGL